MKWFLYINSSGDLLNIRARETAVSKRTFSNVKVKKWVRVVSFLFKPGHRKNLTEVPDAVRSFLDSSTDVPDVASDIRIVEDGIVDEDSPWDLRDLTSKEDRAPSALRRMQELFRTYGLSFSSNV